MKRIFSIGAIFFLFTVSSFAKSTVSDTSRHDTLIIKDGSTFERAIIITEANEQAGDAAEYKWLNDNYPGYSVGSQSLVFHNKKPYDILDIKTGAGIPKEVYFDISNFFGKW